MRVVRRVATFAYAPGEVEDEHVHETHQLVFAADGLLVVHTPEGRWVVPPLRIVWVPAGTRHSINAQVASQMIAIYLDATGTGSLPSTPAVLRVTPLLREIVLHLATADLESEAAERVGAVLADQLAAAATAPLELANLTDPRLRAIQTAFEDDPTEERTLAELARDVGAGVRTLQRLFRTETGASFRQWRTQFRVQHAVIELGLGRSVAEAGARSGYTDTSAFIQAFRDAFGVTPGRYVERDR